MKDEYRPSPLIGARRFHKWATSQLPANVREHYGEFFVWGAHSLIEDHHFAVTAIGEGFDSKPEPSSGSLDCPLCSCKADDGKRADCLIGRFYRAFDSIDSDYIKDWYFGLSEQAAKDVRAFLRVAAPSDLLIREALGRILAREMSPAVLRREGLKVKMVILQGQRARPSKALRNAFMLTAMIAVHESLDIKIAHRPKDKHSDDCAALVARKFGEKASTVRNLWNRLKTRVAVSEDLATDRHRWWRLWKIGREDFENHPVRAASLERLSKKYGGTVAHTRKNQEP